MMDRKILVSEINHAWQDIYNAWFPSCIEAVFCVVHVYN